MRTRLPGIGRPIRRFPSETDAMLSDNPFIISALLHPEYFENIDRYQSSADYLTEVRAMLDGRGWKLRPGGFWTSCQPDGPAERPEAGWKIHVSAVPSTAIETLRRVVPALAERRIQFKYCADPWIFTMSLLKNSARSQAGKFITVYPGSVIVLKETIETLHRATADLHGPYIFSDRAFRDSKVVFYRYGEFYGSTKASPNGSIIRGYHSPTGEWYPDQRPAYFRLPEWVEDPFSSEPPPKPPGDKGVLLAGRYRVTGSLKFSAVGGIYTAEDTSTGDTVVIREARPNVGLWESVGDSVNLLEKEARILKKLGPTGYMPRFVDFFQQWEHRFLVQESLKAESLWGHSMNFYFRRDGLTSHESFEMVRSMITKLVEGLEVVHSHGVVLRDLTKNNVMVTLEDKKVKFIDLEFAYELDRDDPPVPGWTPGYASRDQLENLKPAPADDYYALGALIVDMISYTASGIDLNRRGIMDALRQTLSDIHFPEQILEIVEGLLEQEKERRWNLTKAHETLKATPSPPAGQMLFDNVKGVIPVRSRPAESVVEEISRTVKGLEEFLLDSAEFGRDDWLWPPSPGIYITNPVNFQFGAAGAAFFLLRSSGSVPSEVLDWIKAHIPSNPRLPPGLCSGAAGVALLYLEAGDEERARRILAEGDQPDLIREYPGLFYGAAGWGLANLHFWRRTGDKYYLEQALESGEFLVRTAREETTGLSWLTENQTRLGFGEGGSGIATFLIYLNASRPDARVLETAVRAIEYEISKRQEESGMLTWYPLADSPPNHPKSPHAWFGTAGIGPAVLRCHAATGESHLLEFARQCASSVCLRYTNKLWQDFGLSGFGEFQLDMYQFLGDDTFLWNAFHLAEAILPHRIPRKKGIAFAGEDLYRITCDYGNGCVGIGMFLHRLLHPQTPRLLMLDDLLPATIKQVQTREANRRAVAEVAG